MPNIHQELLIAAPAEAVYRAVTTEKGLSGWWTSGDVKAKPILKSIVHLPFGDGYVKEMQIEELESPSKLKWVCVKGVDQWVGTTLTFTIEEGTKNALLNAHFEIGGQASQADDKVQSLLVFHHDGWKDYTPMFAECSYTWGRFLRSVKLLCETGKGLPFPNQHKLGFE